MAVYRTMVRSKIHRATVTAADLHYIGSITIDTLLLEAADILPYERVQVVDVTNGNRVETYTIAGEAGSGAIQLNGAAAHLVTVGDTVIIMSYAQVEEPVPSHWQPRVVLVDERNIITEIRPLPPGGMAHPSAPHTPRDADSSIDIGEIMREQVPYTGVKFRD